MYGDTATIRRLAQLVSEQADDLRRDADQLVRSSGSVVWDGRAAVAMRRRMGERAVALHRTADRHEDAAAALRRHAAEVERRKEFIADIAARVADLVEEAASRVAALAGHDGDRCTPPAPDPVDELVTRFAPPPRGHRDWLEVPDLLPGLGR